MGIELIVAAGITAASAYMANKSQQKAADKAQNALASQNAQNKQIAAAQTAQNNALAPQVSGLNTQNVAAQMAQNQAIANQQLASNQQNFLAGANYLSPFATGGNAAYQNMLAATGALGQAAQQQYMNTFTSSPYLTGMIKNAGDALTSQYAAAGQSPYGGNAVNALYAQNVGLWDKAYQEQLANLYNQAGIGANASNALFSGYGNLNSLNSQLASYLFGVNSNLTSNLNQTNTGLYNTLMSSNSGLAGGTASNNTALANTGAQLAQKAGDADAAMYNTIGGSLATAVGKQPAGTFSNMFSGTGSNGWGASTVPTSSLA